MTAEELNYRLAWSQTAGEHSALKEVVKFIHQKAADSFVKCDDKTVQILRTLALEIDQKRISASRRLDTYIKSNEAS